MQSPKGLFEFVPSVGKERQYSVYFVGHEVGRYCGVTDQFSPNGKFDFDCEQMIDIANAMKIIYEKLD